MSRVCPFVDLAWWERFVPFLRYSLSEDLTIVGKVEEEVVIDAKFGWDGVLEGVWIDDIGGGGSVSSSSGHHDLCSF
jgi:hypothetical protein